MRRSAVLVVVVLSISGLVGAGGPALAKVSGPNGQIAFSRFDPTLGDTTTFIVNPDGSGLRAIFPGQQTALPRWSPDGSLLAFLFPDDNPCPPVRGLDGHPQPRQRELPGPLASGPEPLHQL